MKVNGNAVPSYKVVLVQLIGDNVGVGRYRQGVNL